jgi:hypothetical protein
MTARQRRAPISLILSSSALASMMGVLLAVLIHGR